MANCDYTEAPVRNIKDRLERDLLETLAHREKVEAALRFLAANPGAQELMELIR